MLNRIHHVFVPAAIVAGVALCPAASAAQRLVASVSGTTFQVGSTNVVRSIVFVDPGEPITGIGFDTLWTAVVADQQDGVFPWSIDLSITVTPPGGAPSFTWGPNIGGDRTIADYPLQDATEAFAGVDGAGTWTWEFDSGNSAPWVIGLENPTYHLLAEAPDVVEVFEGSTAEGPLWNRPFFIAGVSGLGPVVYQVTEFTVPVSGLYTITSVVSSGNNFTCLYEGAFDPSLPLENLLDYGLGNGFGPNGTPQGTSLIEALLFEGTTYYFVNSQWAASSPGTPYTNTIVGPAAIDLAGADCPGDADGSGGVDLTDLNIVLGGFGTAGPAGDLDGSGTVDLGDLNAVLANFGSGC